jgi:IS5 family transposase
MEKYDNLGAWRKVANWKYELKGLMRELGKASASGGKNKQVRMVAVAKKCIKMKLSWQGKFGTQDDDYRFAANL